MYSTRYQRYAPHYTPEGASDSSEELREGLQAASDPQFWARLREPLEAGSFNHHFRSFFYNPDGELCAIARVAPKPEAIRRRLDDVCGPDGWSSRIEYGPDRICQCYLTIHVADGRSITRTGLSERGDLEAADSAMVLAALDFGIGTEAPQRGEYVRTVSIEAGDPDAPDAS
jgi:hypothetical protein